MQTEQNQYIFSHIKRTRGEKINKYFASPLILKSVNLQFNTVGRWDDDMIVPPSDGPMIIWIDWE